MFPFRYDTDCNFRKTIKMNCLFFIQSHLEPNQPACNTKTNIKALRKLGESYVSHDQF